MDQTTLRKVTNNYVTKVIDSMSVDELKIVLREYLTEPFYKSNGQLDQDILISDMIEYFGDSTGEITTQFLVDNGVDYETADDLVSTF